ncbi:MAG: hypothetical protein Q7J43_20620 [Pseudomonas sp.]|uniref:hypothetical protein n=1 Tax=Pseudomonas sp. TaxID=306 RepID=UPI00271809A4|nr:hypothetical protein [Pseudomonas sp.]MDO9620077.1 hypothetical protein [Pseudomonas sp.]MDP2445160.1 hypothetical protein [Pseudomonas sp.]MDZ4313755.1 hypothetical protein [Azonexus sp.]
MFKYISLVIFFTLSICVQANDCTYDFDQDNKCDSYTVTPLSEAEGLNLLTISLGSGNNISGIFNTGSAGITSGYFPGEIIVPLDFYSPKTVQQSTYTFRWHDGLKNWVLIKESNWAEPYRDEIYSLSEESIPKEAQFPTEFEVNRIKCCILLSDFKEQMPRYQILNEEQSVAAINEDIDYLKTMLKSGKESPLFYKAAPANEENRKPIPADLIYEISTALTTQNVAPINNYAFYMQQTGSHILATIVFRSIYKKYPQRIVTKINLADSYWEIGFKEESCHLYGEYVKDMMLAGKKSLVPSRAYSRSDCSIYPKNK